MGNNMKKKVDFGNKGFSFVEMIVVVAIFMVLGLITSYGIVVLTSRPVDECAKKIQIALEGNRVTTMGKLSASIEFYLDDDNNVVIMETINDVPQSEIIIGQNVVTVTAEMIDGTQFDLSKEDDEHIVIQFDRSCGSVKADASGNIVCKFIVSRGDKELTVNLDPLTGRVEVE